jgi:nucleotide-binding universal stress UspA family protein
MYERILVPLDGSKVGEAALPIVEELVSKLSPELKVEVTLFQVVSSLSHYIVAGEATARVPYTEKELDVIKQKARDYLSKAGEPLKSKGAIVKTRVSTGHDTAEEIGKAAEQVKADLVAMSTHGRSGIGRWAFGSVTDKVLRGGKTPVLMVRAPKDVSEA